MSLFTEKYRPKTREEIVGNKEELDRLFSIVNQGNIPHMIFKGPPGTGKTSTALVIARQLMGDFYHSNFLELNASDERGIDVVRNEIKTFCRITPMGTTQFKILFLSEADNMTRDAQEALRRIMEQYSNSTRFILDTNYPEKLIEAITSRCEEFRFSPLSPDAILQKITYISKQENIQIDEEALKYLSENSNGDMRKALNKLQVLSSYGQTINKTLLNISEEKEQSSQIVQTLLQGRFLQARQILKEMMLLGYSERDLVGKLHQVFVSDSLALSPQKKGECILELAETDYRLTLGVSKGLQLDALLLKLLKIMKLN